MLKEGLATSLSSPGFYSEKECSHDVFSSSQYFFSYNIFDQKNWFLSDHSVNLNEED